VCVARGALERSGGASYANARAVADVQRSRSERAARAGPALRHADSEWKHGYAATDSDSGAVRKGEHRPGLSHSRLRAAIDRSQRLADTIRITNSNRRAYAAAWLRRGHGR